ncbi:MAG: YceD family protein [Stackebrandtia sp.]
MPSSTPPLDPKAPLVANTRTLPRSPGSAKEWSAEAAFAERLGPDLIAVPAGTPVSVRVTLTSVSEGILASGTASAETHGECARCLTEIDDTLRVEVSELYAFEDSTTAETTDEDEVMRLQGDLLDLEPAVRDALVFGMPNSPLCRPDCPGLCSGCGEPWDQLPEGHGHEAVDPRWAELKKLL